MAELIIGEAPWSAVPSIWPKAETCIVDANGIAIAHVINRERAPLLALAPELLAFVDKIARLDPVLAKGAEKKRIKLAQQLVDRAAGVAS